jgi:hypothetical protein
MTREQALQVLIDILAAAVVEEIVEEGLYETPPDSDTVEQREAA